MDIPSIVIRLFENVAILIMLTFIYSLLRPHITRLNLRWQSIANGILFGGFATLVMMSPVILAPGVFIDGRTIILAVVGAVFGWQSALSALLVATPFRIFIGGTGLIAGIGAMLTSAAFGVWMHRQFHLRKQSYQPQHWLGLGVAVSLQRVLWLTLLPAEVELDPGIVLLPVLLVYPLGTYLLGTLLIHEISRIEIEAALRQTTQSLSDFNRHLKQLHRISTYDYPDLDTLFTDCLQTGCKIFGMTTGIVSEVRGETYLIRAAQSAIPTLTKGRELALENTYCAAAVRGSGKSLAYPHIGTMPEMRKHPVYQEYALESFLCALIFVNERIYGTLSFFSESPRTQSFESAEIEMVELLAKTISSTLSANLANAERARMLETTQRHFVELQTLHQQVSYQAEHDYLTGLPNRYTFEKQLQTVIANAHPQQIFTILYIDLDRFKIINDTLGHAVGDAFLCHITNRLQSCMHANSILARLGGDEFAVLIPEIEQQEAGILLAQNILSALSKPLSLEDQEITPSASIGISFYPLHGRDMATLLRRADNALYQSKNQGRNTYQVYNPEVLDTDGSKRLILEHHLRRALEQEQMHLYYQPQVDVVTRRIVGFEALLRWHHPTRGVVSPAKFIPIAEESGLIVPLGTWALQEACRQGQMWQQKLGLPLKIAVNVSAVQFRRDDFIDTVAQALNESGFTPACLELEVTETLLMNNSEQALSRLKQLKALGIHLAIDDFGTGFSSLSYLQDFPIDTIKIDRSFIKNIHTDSYTRSGEVIVKAIAQLAHNLNMQVMAEGIETEEQFEFVRELGCSFVQGFLFNPPLSVEQVDVVLAQY